MIKSLSALDTRFDVEEALKEVREKKKEKIEEETAYKWASRAMACYQLHRAATDPGEKGDWYIQAEEYRHEAIEHAAMTEDGGKILRDVLEAIEKERQ